MCSRQDGWVTLFLGQLENLVASWKDVQRDRPRVRVNVLLEPKAEEPSDLHLEGQGVQPRGRPFFAEIGSARSSPRTGPVPLHLGPHGERTIKTQFRLSRRRRWLDVKALQLQERKFA